MSVSERHKGRLRKRVTLQLLPALFLTQRLLPVTSEKRWAPSIRMASETLVTVPMPSSVLSASRLFRQDQFRTPAQDQCLQIL